MKLQKFYIKGVKKIQKNFFNKGDKSFNSAARILLKVLKNSIASLIMEKAISKKIELMKEKSVRKEDNFEVLSPKADTPKTG